MVFKNFLTNELILKSVVVILATYYNFSYVFIAIRRIYYPFEIEWMEGGTLIHIKRLWEGLPLYIAPDIGFTPAIYTPLYYYIAILPVKIWGLNFLSIRILSFTSSILIGICIYYIIKFNTKNRFYSYIALSLYFASFKVTGAWFDIGRVDSLAILFIMLGYLSLINDNFFINNILSPLFMLAAYFTKQNSIVVAFAAVIYLFFYRKKSLNYFLILFFIPLIIIHLIFNQSSEGWFNYYTLILSNSLDNKYQRLLTFWINDLIKNLPLIFFVLISISFNKKIINLTPKYLFFLLPALIFMSLSGRIKIGGYENAIIPAFLGLILAYANILYLLNKYSDKTYHKFIYLSIIIQFVVLYYPLSTQIPTNNDVEEGKKFIKLVSSFEGDVFLPDHPYYLIMAGKDFQAHTMAISDFLNSSNLKIYKSKLIKKLNNDFKDQKYDALVFSSSSKDFFSKFTNFQKYYKLVNSNLTGNNLNPLTGAENKPTYLFIKENY